MCLLLLCGLAFAAQAEEAAGEILYYDSAYGRVVSLDKEAMAITIEEFRAEDEEEADFTYTVRRDAEFSGVDDISGIRLGDWVDVEYHADAAGNKEAYFIGVETEARED